MYQVIIVEDDEEMLRMNKAYVERDSRFNVRRVFRNGKEAYAYLLDNSVDLVISDINMPYLTGLEMLSALRGKGIRTDVIMVTAANDGKTLATLMDQGITDYLVKPYTAQRFQQALDAFCMHREALDNLDDFSQEELDKYLFIPHESQAEMPKGMQKGTLDNIRAFLKGAPEREYTSGDISREVGLSVVTVRRYMKYLTENGEVESLIKYDTGGRPSTCYRMKLKPE